MYVSNEGEAFGSWRKVKFFMLSEVTEGKKDERKNSNEKEEEE